MILAAGLTPAWQHILLFDHLQTGQVNRAQSSLWCASGKVINVGAALHHLQSDSTTLCPVGGKTGDQIRADFASRGVQAHWLPTQASTRVCTTLLDVGSGTTTELVENSTALSTAELADYEDMFSDLAKTANMVIFSGSLPQGTGFDFYRRLMDHCDAPTILDVRGRELIECLPRRPFLVKPNREELGATVGRSLHTDAEVEEAMQQIQQRGAQWVVVSQGSKPLLILGPDGRLSRIEPPQVRAVNPIGCGDSLTAAIAAKIHAQASPMDAIQFGVDYAARKAAILYPVLTEAAEITHSSVRQYRVDCSSLSINSTTQAE